MVVALRRGVGILLCTVWTGCCTPEFYGPSGREMKPPLTVIRPDAPSSPLPNSDAVASQDQTLPPAPPSAIVPVSATATEPSRSSASNPQKLPDTIKPDGRADLEHARQLVQLAQTRMESLENYMVRFRRREVIQGRSQPEDLLLCKFRQKPYSVYMKSIGNTPTEGREVVFVAGKYQNLMQVRTGKGDVISGICLELEPHSARATANSRRTIDEAGLGRLVERIAGMLQRVEAGQTQETLTYLGPQPRVEARLPLEAIAQKLPPGQEKLLPSGGKRTFYFQADPESAEYQLPILVITEDETGREVEYYFYDRLCPNVGLTEKDFDPGALWGKR